MADPKPARSSAEKIKKRAELAKECQDLQKRGLKIGFTSGTFDLLHSGHVSYLEHARTLCDVLVVGVNSDESVRAYKDPHRPIVPEQDRALVVAGLGCVEFVFVFGETNNNENVRALKPDLYIKAGDYSKQGLSSAAIVEEYGGKVAIAPFKEGFSTSAIIDKITEGVIAKKTFAFKSEPSAPRPAVFLDRDGTLIEHLEYLHEPEKVRVLSGAIEGLKLLQDAGFYLVVVTNQPGIGLGYFTKEQFFAVNREMFKQFSRSGIAFDKVYFCPHSLSEKCECRKPGTALVQRALEELSIDKAKSFFIGDMTSDVECGKRAGLKTILIQTGRGGADKLFDSAPTFKAKSLMEAATSVLTPA